MCLSGLLSPEQLQRRFALDASVLDQAVCHWTWTAVFVSVVRDGVVLTGSILVLLGIRACVLRI